MSVLIKRLHLPDCCWNCPCLDGEEGYCNISGKTIRGDGERPADCPLFEIPDHGDLIDRDELMMKMWEASAYAPNHCSWVNARVVFARDIEDAPVVIPAERSEDGET